MLFRIFQRSQLYSNSQHGRIQAYINRSCFEYFKDLNYTAIHNYHDIEALTHALFRIFQRSQLYSNSQQWAGKTIAFVSCFEYFKDLNYTAIHNIARCAPLVTTLFRIFQRSQLYSNSQRKERIAK